ncbi:MAG: hypothetical protein MJ074_07725 [Oscillospiraceae bacterium]|nr:hypothetical protein [Oscillospiraceae bacterium]
MTAPCQGCERRSVNCHSGCELYQAYRGYRDELIKERATENDIAGAIKYSARARMRRQIHEEFQRKGLH